MKGGYQIINLTGVTYGETPTNIPGIYEKLHLGKVLLLEGLAQTEWAPSQVKSAGMDVELTLSNGDTLTIDSDDDVYLTAAD